MKTIKSMPYLCAALIMAAAACALKLNAADSTKASDPTGTWKWKFEMQNGQTFESTLKLKREGDKLTGALIGRNGNETQIQDGRIQQDDVTFTVVREFNGQKMTAKYSGKLSGDTIKGKVETERDGQTRSRDWEAKRDSGGNATGTWKWTFEIPNGPTLEPSAKLTQEGDKLSGVLIMGDRERPISEGTVKNGEVSFKVVSKRDDQTVTSKYYGKLSGDTIKGKWDSDWSGEVVTRDWEAKRAKD